MVKFLARGGYWLEMPGLLFDYAGVYNIELGGETAADGLPVGVRINWSGGAPDSGTPVEMRKWHGMPDLFRGYFHLLYKHCRIYHGQHEVLRITHDSQPDKHGADAMRPVVENRRKFIEVEHILQQMRLYERGREYEDRIVIREDGSW